MKLLIVLVAFFGATFATPNDALGVKSAAILKRAADTFDDLDEGSRISLINEFVDMALEESKYFMIEQGYDPMQLPDLYEKISFRPIIITYWGSLNLTRGWLQDASTIQRNGDVSLDYTNRILSLKVPIKFRDFVFDYQYKIKIMGLGPRGGLDGKCTDIRVSFTLAVDFNILRINLKQFDIDKIGKITLKFNGNVLTDWLVNIATSVITTFFKGIIKWVCELIIRDVLLDICDAVNNILAQLVPDPEIVKPIFQQIIK